jgi:hypothetical protein
MRIWYSKDKIQVAIYVSDRGTYNVLKNKNEMVARVS